MKRRHILLGGALTLTGALVLFGDKAGSDGVAEAAPRQPARTAAPSAPRASGAASAPLDVPVGRLLARADLIGAGDPDDASLFGAKDWTPPPPPPPRQSVQPAPAPSAPPLPFTVLGKSWGDGQWEVFLAQGERTVIVRAKLVIDGVYRVDAIAPPTLTLTYLPLNQVQQLNIGVFN